MQTLSACLSLSSFGIVATAVSATSLGKALCLYLTTNTRIIHGLKVLTQRLSMLIATPVVKIHLL